MGDTSGNSTIRALSYNIHKGFTAGNRAYVLQEIRSAIRSTQADIVFLQEVQGIGSNHDHIQFEFLADEIWPHYAYGKNAILEKSHHGNAILSRFPLLQWMNIDLSTNTMEQRGLLYGIANLDISGGQRAHLFCTHLGLFEAGRRKQISRVIEFIQDRVPPDEPVILAGDFNDWRETLGAQLKTAGFIEAFEVLHGRLARTFPSHAPRLCLDRIYLKGFQAKSAYHPDPSEWSRLSDHSPLLVEVFYGSVSPEPLK